MARNFLWILKHEIGPDFLANFEHNKFLADSAVCAMLQSARRALETYLGFVTNCPAVVRRVGRDHTVELAGRSGVRIRVVHKQLLEPPTVA